MPATRLQHDVALPQTRSKLVWGLLSSLCRDTNTNPASTPHGAGEESQTDQLGRAGRNAQPEGEAFVWCLDMQTVAGRKLTTLLVKAGKVQLRINDLKQSLADGLFPPSFAPKAVPFGEATESMQARWRELDNSFWKQRTEMAVVFESENLDKANDEVTSHLEGTTKFLREANCTPLGIQKLAEAWDQTQEESVKIAQHQLETAEKSRKRGKGNKKVGKHTTLHSPFQSRPKGRNWRERVGRRGTFSKKAKAKQKPQTKAHASEEELQTSSPLTSCANSVHCNCPVCCSKINLAPANLGRLIRACKKGTPESKTSGKFLCNLSDFTLGEETIRLLSKGLTFIPKPIREKKDTLRREVQDFIRKLRLKYVFRNRDKPVPELYRKTWYDPGKTESIVLEQFIDKLRETLSLVIKQRPSRPPKDNLGLRMRKALDALQRQKQFLVFRKADKGSVIVLG